MKIVSVLAGAVPTKLAAAGNRDFCHIYNDSAVTVYVCYDSDDATAVAGLSTANGIPIEAGQLLQINNDGQRNLYNKPIYAVHGDAAPQNVRLQGEA